MKVTTGRSCTSCEWSCGAWHWQNFVDDRLVPKDAPRSSVGTKKIHRWDLYVQPVCVLCDGHDSTQESFKSMMLSIMESVNWVCEEIVEEREWVSRTLF